MTNKELEAIQDIALPDSFTVVATVKLPGRIELRRPEGMQWIMVHPHDCVARVATIQMPTERGQKIFVVRGDVLPFVNKPDIKVMSFHRAITSEGDEFVWPARTEGDDSWSKSLREIVELAKGSWVRVQSDSLNGRYVGSLPKGELPTPTWSGRPWAQLLSEAYSDRLIDGPDHPVLKHLRGDR